MADTYHITGDPVSLHTCFTKVNDDDITIVIILSIIMSNTLKYNNTPLLSYIRLEGNR